ncbi:50S ribosomal protein L5 [Candidatus Gracilibacteria bacterium]|nr:50S ribosomal protein L5 [Candidatus Gracilibacteria bacterium]
MSDSIKLQSTEYYTAAKNELLKESKDANVFALPKIDKISINVGIGDFKNDSKLRSDVEKYLFQLTGQKPKVVQSKVSVAGFKLRKGEPIGMVLTLRGKRMYDFLLNLVFLSLPRTRDFRGIPDSSFDKEYKSYSLGIRSSSVFPLIGFDTGINFGMQINLVFNQGREENKKTSTKT